MGKLSSKLGKTVKLYVFTADEVDIIRDNVKANLSVKDFFFAYMRPTSKAFKNSTESGIFADEQDQSTHIFSMKKIKNIVFTPNSFFYVKTFFDNGYLYSVNSIIEREDNNIDIRTTRILDIETETLCQKSNKYSLRDVLNG